MAWLDTDWTKELEQVNAAMSTLLDEKVEPMVDRALNRSVEEISVVVAKASFELRDAVEQLSLEINQQRELAAKDGRRLINYAALMAVVVFILCAGLYKILF